MKPIPSKTVTDAFTSATVFYITLLIGMGIISRLEGGLPSAPSSPLSFLTISAVSLLFTAAVGLSRGRSVFRLGGGLRSSALAFGLFLAYLVVVILPVMGFVYAYGGVLRVDWLRGLTSLGGLAGGLLSALFMYGYVVPSLLRHLRGLRGILTTSFTALPLNMILWGVVWYIYHPTALLFTFGTLLPMSTLLVYLVLKWKSGLASSVTFALINWRFYWVGFTIPSGRYEPYIDAAVSGVASYLLLALVVLLIRQTESRDAVMPY